ncbi:acyl-CoA dehydrogenase family protein [Plantactinospora solaniradicis]|uniref:Acyl-CoA dehydrogenase family protein n=1 Tax=Plantactinospora solaniradicis TaxID=1723736 RepID=A0ABW1KEQ6_9ACTN
MTSALIDQLHATRYPGMLDALHRRVCSGELVPAPTGYVAASVTALPTAEPTPFARFGLAVAPWPGPAVPADVAARFASGLLDLNRAVLRRALDQAVRHLGERSSEGTSLLAKQLVQAQLADIAMGLREDEVMPPERRSGDPAARWRTHQRLVRLGRAVLYLFGASGFLVGGPAGEIYLAEVTGNIYLHPGTEDSDA